MEHQTHEHRIDWSSPGKGFICDGCRKAHLIWSDDPTIMRVPVGDVTKELEQAIDEILFQLESDIIESLYNEDLTSDEINEGCINARAKAMAEVKKLIGDTQ